MPRFRFRACDETGTIEKGVLVAESKEEAVRAVTAEGRRILRLDEEQSGLWTELTKERSFDRLTERGLALFFRKLATLSSAGVSLEDALIIAEKAPRPGPANLLAGRLLASLRDGASLAQAMKQEQSAFSDQYIAMVRAGEIGGALPKILNRIADMLERSIAARESVRSAMIYPAILAVTSTLAIGTIFFVVLPSFEPIFDQAGADLPALTAIVLSLSRFVNNNAIFILIAFALLVVISVRLLAADTIRLRFDRFLASAPLIGDYLKQSELGQTCAILGALLNNGVSLDAALKLVRKVPPNRAFQAGLAQIHEAVVDGKPLSSAFEEWPLSPEILPQLARAGESAGALGEMISRAAEMLEHDAKRSVDRAISMLTPLLTLLLGGIVAIIVFSVLLAVLSVNDLAL